MHLSLSKQKHKNSRKKSKRSGISISPQKDLSSRIKIQNMEIQEEDDNDEKYEKVQYHREGPYKRKIRTKKTSKNHLKRCSEFYFEPFNALKIEKPKQPSTVKLLEQYQLFHDQAFSTVQSIYQQTSKNASKFVNKESKIRETIIKINNRNRSRNRQKSKASKPKNQPMNKSPQVKLQSNHKEKPLKIVRLRCGHLASQKAQKQSQSQKINKRENLQQRLIRHSSFVQSQRQYKEKKFFSPYLSTIEHERSTLNIQDSRSFRYASNSKSNKTDKSVGNRKGISLSHSTHKLVGIKLWSKHINSDSILKQENHCSK